MVNDNMYTAKRMNSIGQKFIDHFEPGGKVKDTLVGHPGETDPNYLHIDIFRYDSVDYYYLFSVGCSLIKNYNGNRCEVFFRIKKNLPEELAKEILGNWGSLFDVTGYKKDHQLHFLNNNKYYYDDNARELWFNELDNGNFCGFYIFEAFPIPSRPGIVYYEVVPASRLELDFIEAHYDTVPCAEFINALKPFLGDRTDLLNCHSLTTEEMQRIYELLVHTNKG